MTIASFTPTNYNTQTGTAYPLQIDANFAVLQQVGAAFAAQAQATPDMSVLVNAGDLFSGAGVTAVVAQTSASFTAPTGNPRIDRVVLAQATGTVSVVTGTPAASPAPPAIPAGFEPCAQVLLQTTTTAITNSLITDERCLSSLGLGSAAFAPIGTAGTVVPELSGANTWSAEQTFGTGGVVVGSPTGGNLGTGTINAQGVAVNGVSLPFTQSFSATPFPAAGGSRIVLAHGLSVEPTLINLVLQCVTAELGYSVGARVRIPPGIFVNGSSGYGTAVIADNTNIYVIVGGIFIFNGNSPYTAAEITGANWELCVTAWA